MKTWTDEELILYFYEELDDFTNKELKAALDESTSLTARYAELKKLLGEQLVTDMPRPSNDLNQRIMRGVHELKSQNDNQLAGSRPHNDAKNERQGYRFLAWLGLEPNYGFAGAIAAITLVIAITFFIGRWSAPPAIPGDAVVTIEKTGSALEQDTRQASRRVLLSSVSAHLESGQRLLTEVANSSADNKLRLDARSQMIDDLIEFNRLYRRLASQSNDTALVQILQQMEGVLLELNNTEAADQSSTLDSVRERMQDTDLIFKLRVTEKKLDRENI